MKQVRLIKQVMMVDHNGEPYEEADLTVGKVYDIHVDSETCEELEWYVVTDRDDRHYFDSLDSPADESGFKSSDYWELVE